MYESKSEHILRAHITQLLSYIFMQKKLVYCLQHYAVFYIHLYLHIILHYLFIKMFVKVFIPSILISVGMEGYEHVI